MPFEDPHKVYPPSVAATLKHLAGLRHSAKSPSAQEHPAMIHELADGIEAFLKEHFEKWHK